MITVVASVERPGPLPKEFVKGEGWGDEPVSERAEGFTPLSLFKKDQVKIKVFVPVTAARGTELDVKRAAKEALAGVSPELSKASVFPFPGKLRVPPSNAYSYVLLSSLDCSEYTVVDVTCGTSYVTAAVYQAVRKALELASPFLRARGKVPELGISASVGKEYHLLGKEKVAKGLDEVEVAGGEVKPLCGDLEKGRKLNAELKEARDLLWRLSVPAPLLWLYARSLAGDSKLADELRELLEEYSREGQCWEVSRGASELAALLKYFLLAVPKVGRLRSKTFVAERFEAERLSEALSKGGKLLWDRETRNVDRALRAGLDRLTLKVDDALAEAEEAVEEASLMEEERRPERLKAFGRLAGPVAEALSRGKGERILGELKALRGLLSSGLVPYALVYRGEAGPEEVLLWAYLAASPPGAKEFLLRAGLDPVATLISEEELGYYLPYLSAVEDELRRSYL